MRTAGFIGGPLWLGVALEPVQRAGVGGESRLGNAATAVIDALRNPGAEVVVRVGVGGLVVAGVLKTDSGLSAPESMGNSDGSEMGRPS